MTSQTTSIRPANPSVDDFAQSAADRWGSRTDPCRADFIRGYKDQQAGSRNAPAEMAANAAYNSGYVAARDDGVI